MPSRGLSSARPTQDQLGRLISTGGTRRRYVDPLTGESFARRATEEEQLKYGLRAKPAPAGKMSRYNNLVTDRAKESGQTRGQVRQDPEFKKAVKDLRSTDRSPTGKKAQALVYIGRRAPDETAKVGETPKGKKKR